ncbi:hypothetical protein [Oleiagrimonas sp.]|uniref:hypothetical protein n=1 Tax=Oleiagrimonas sp. TaxID=2010330 RepID=UPI0026255295|nr:hypothetical protein [Oleiagrimonas sp.]MDA3913261.1 hypothetical protein [Oleiagrimonas sp.]
MILIIAIVASILVTMLDSVQDLHLRFGKAFFITEWAFTLVFTAELASGSRNARAQGLRELRTGRTRSRCAVLPPLRSKIAAHGCN